jgi:transposase InsO family protein
VVVEVRTTLKRSVEDLLVVVREFIHSGVSRSGWDRCLRRHGVSNLAALRAGEEGTPAPRKTFKDDEPGFVHIDVQYLPQLPGESQRRYLLVAIDRATRWVYLEIHPQRSAECATAFLERLRAAAPLRIVKRLTDHGAEFTDRFLKGDDPPSGQHTFDQTCAEHHIEHRLIPPRHPQTNGMVERFNGRIREILTTTHCNASEDLDRTLERYLQM